MLHFHPEKKKKRRKGKREERRGQVYKNCKAVTSLNSFESLIGNHTRFKCFCFLINKLKFLSVDINVLLKKEKLTNYCS